MKAKHYCPACGHLVTESRFWEATDKYVNNNGDEHVADLIVKAVGETKKEIEELRKAIKSKDEVISQFRDDYDELVREFDKVTTELGMVYNRNLWQRIINKQIS